MTSLTVSQHRAVSRPTSVVAVASIAALTFLVYYALAPVHSGDADLWFVPWLNNIIADGPVQSLASAMPVTVEAANGRGNYTPPYLYLLIVGSLAKDVLVPLAIVKLVSIAGTFLCAAFMYRLLRAFLSPEGAVVGAAGLLLLPTVALNAAAWGQSEALYGGFVVLAVAAAFREKWVLMMLALGVALSFKLQAALIGPFILYMVISRRVPLWTCLLPPLVYVALMLPAWLAGRPAWELATIYVDQAQTWRWLSMSAPNPWAVVQSLRLVSYDVGVPLGLAIGAVAGFALAALGFRRRLEGADLLLLAVGCSILMPYLLPKMHDRYFFLAELLSYALCIVKPRAWTIAVAAAVQLGAVSAYSSTLFTFAVGPHLGAVFIGLALMIVIFQLIRVLNQTDGAGAKLPDRA